MTEKEKYINDFLRSHKARVDKDNRIHIECLCDSTIWFLIKMVDCLKMIGCTDIKTDGEKITEGIPEDKPWCNCLYKASGILPEGINWTGGEEMVRTMRIDVSENKYYIEFDGIRLVYEDDKLVGWYEPNLDRVV